MLGRGGKTIAVLEASNKTLSRPFAELDRVLLSLLSSQVREAGRGGGRGGQGAWGRVGGRGRERALIPHARAAATQAAVMLSHIQVADDTTLVLDVRAVVLAAAPGLAAGLGAASAAAAVEAAETAARVAQGSRLERELAAAAVRVRASRWRVRRALWA